MALHLLKLCVGAQSIADLEEWITTRSESARRRGEKDEQFHVTRMVPKRIEELAGGSLYWVIKGRISARQRLLAVQPFTDEQGIGRCRLVLEPTAIAVAPRPFRAFQGWRYLRADEAPPDLQQGEMSVAQLPEALRRELADLGLL